MPRLLIDIYKTKNLNSGIGQFSINFAEELLKTVPPDFKTTFLVPSTFHEHDFSQINILRNNFLNRNFPWLNRGYDLWHSLHQFPSHFPGPKTKWVLTIHDLNFLVEKSEKKAANYLNKLQASVDRATAVTVISGYTEKLVRENLRLSGKPLHMIHNGIKIKSFPDARKPGFIKKENFFFAIGIITAKKNFQVLLPLMTLFPDWDLIIAGNIDSPYARQLIEQVNSLGLANRVRLPGNIDEQQKYWLYSHCDALFFPSLAEGFGMPLIEAMLMGKPVFSSRNASLPEIGGEYAFYWENFEPEHMAEVVRNGLSRYAKNKEQLSASIIAHARGFSWTTCIEKYLSVYREVLR